jgi:uncharacterized protein YycO
MAAPGMTRPRVRGRRLQRIAGAAALLGVLCAAAFGWRWWSTQAACLRYAPAEGDVIFQSLPHGPIVWAIEGVTRSPYSHCGIVAKQDGRWIVYEAYEEVSATPLRTFLFRGRGGGFAVYRLRSPYREHIPRTLECCTAYLGRPYDIRYRLDDEAIYCSELVYKAYRDATHGQQLGRLVRFGDMNWRPYETLIEQVEGGAVPVDREMITPVDLAKAPQLEPVFSHQLRVEQTEEADAPPSSTGAPVTRDRGPRERSQEDQVAGEDRPHAE